ncbi:MAG: SulP family inorganic anion transporter [Planctomycetota bacterium]
MRQKLVPKTVTVIQEGLSSSRMLQDAMAGLSVAMVALPLSLAFAIASGAKPEQGWITAIVAGFLISLLSGSRVQIGGPTGAFIVIIDSVIRKHGYDGLAMATMMAGGLLVVMGLFRLGSFIKFIPYPLTVGFTSAIAILIFVAQINDFLGLGLSSLPVNFIDKCCDLARHAAAWNPQALVTGLISLGLMAFWPKVSKKIPGTIVAILIATILVHALAWPVETIGSRFGTLPASLPAPRLPVIDFEHMRDLIPEAFTIAILAAIVSLLSALVADGMTGHRHRSDMEILAQGIANMVTPLFCGLPAMGAVARTTTNIRHGGRTPVAGMVHALVLLAILILCARWVSYIPMPTMSAVIMMVAYNMFDWKTLASVFRAPSGDVLILLNTFFLTIFASLTTAIEVGIVLASLYFMKKMSDVSGISCITRNLEEESADPYSLKHRKLPDGVEVFEIEGAFFFGVADKFRDTLGVSAHHPKVLILRLRHVPYIDATGTRMLEEFVRNSQAAGTHLIFSGVHGALSHALKRSGIESRIGVGNILPDIDAAIERARILIAEAPAPGPLQR